MAASYSSSPHSPEMSTPFSSMMRPIVSRISESTPTRPLRSAFQRSDTEARPPGTASLFQQMPANPPCHGQGHLAARVEVDVLQRGREVRDVRDVAVVELLRVAEADPASDHPVGEADRVGADVLPERELVLHLAVVRVVVVDGDLVVDLDAGLLFEGLRGSGSCPRHPRRCTRPSSPSSASCRWRTCLPRESAWTGRRRWSRLRGRARPRRRLHRPAACGDSPASGAPGRSGLGSSDPAEVAVGSRGTPFGSRARSGVGRYCHTAGQLSSENVRIVNFWRTPGTDSVRVVRLGCGFSRCGRRRPLRPDDRLPGSCDPALPDPVVEQRRQNALAREDAVLARAAVHDNYRQLADRCRQAPARGPGVGVADESRVERSLMPLPHRVPLSQQPPRQARAGARSVPRARMTSASARGMAETTAWMRPALELERRHARRRGRSAHRRRDHLEAVSLPLPGAGSVASPPQLPATAGLDEVGPRGMAEEHARTEGVAHALAEPMELRDRGDDGEPLAAPLPHDRLDRLEGGMPVVVGPRAEPCVEVVDHEEPRYPLPLRRRSSVAKTVSQTALRAPSGMTTEPSPCSARDGARDRGERRAPAAAGHAEHEEVPVDLGRPAGEDSDAGARARRRLRRDTSDGGRRRRSVRATRVRRRRRHESRDVGGGDPRRERIEPWATSARSIRMPRRTASIAAGVDDADWKGTGHPSPRSMTPRPGGSGRISAAAGVPTTAMLSARCTTRSETRIAQFAATCSRTTPFGPLRAEHEMHAERAPARGDVGDDRAELGEPLDHRLELVDDDHEPGELDATDRARAMSRAPAPGEHRLAVPELGPQALTPRARPRPRRGRSRCRSRAAGRGSARMPRRP